MHILFTTSLLPEPEPTTGFEIANRAIADAYRAAGARVTVAGFRRPGVAPPPEPHVDFGELAIENAGAGALRKAGWVAEALRSGLPIGAAKLRAMPEPALLERLCRAGPFDAVVLSAAQLPIAFPGLASLAPFIFVAHNVEHLSAAEMGESARGIVSRLLYRREARLLRTAETRLCAQARVVHSLALADAERLGLGGDPRSLPLSLAIGRGTAPADDGERRFDVVMIGTWSWAPNRLGLDWFLESVAPLLPSDIRIGIAGRLDGAPPAAPAQVSFLGRVPDAQGFVRAGRVVALATRGGTGVQLKTIETLEEGMPAVATPSALRGIGAALPANLRVADDPRGFAQALVDLVRRERGGETLRLDGRPFAERQRADLERGVRAGLALAVGGPNAVPVPVLEALAS
ncbi:glycosyltransferase [Aureimonas flava]|uniref:Glycosyltransferase n=1 Tax=Aureimonas flava TaxID=2320271 RepID=A0A3A1WHH7_9HYPH|nr:glycosyltransferase family 4 protein [Aureimonas flava]RIY00044.1 glycosyltransferase [Aureimonas flava]